MLQQSSRIGLKGIRHLRKRQFIWKLSYAHMASPVHKAFPESRPRRLHCPCRLMSLVGNWTLCLLVISPTRHFAYWTLCPLDSLPTRHFTYCLHSSPTNCPLCLQDCQNNIRCV